MHLPAVNAVSDPEVLCAFIKENPLGMLITGVPSSQHKFLQASHIPWLIDNLEDGTKLQLRGHIARQNPQAKAMIEALTTPTDEEATDRLCDEVLVIFNGPVHHYVTPKFYKSTKPATGKVVPTWDYEAVEVYGRAKVFHGSKAEETGRFLTAQIGELSNSMETSIMGYDGVNGTAAWDVNDAPPRYIELLSKNIIGIEIEITSMSGRFKWSQEKPVGDRAGVIEGFEQLGSPLGAQIAAKITHQASVYDATKART